MGYCSISPTCRTVSDSAPLRGRGGQRGGRGRAGAGRQSGAEGSGRAGEGGGSTGSGHSAAGSARPPRRGAGTSEGGGEGAQRAVTALGQLGQPHIVAQDLAASLRSLRRELGRKKPLRVRCSSSPPSGFIRFSILMSLWIIHFWRGLLVSLLELLLLFKTSWIGLHASQRGKRWRRAGAHGDRGGCGGRRAEASLGAPEKGAAPSSEGLGVRAQPVRGRPHLLGTRIFRGVCA